jgi:hypothetical protein
MQGFAVARPHSVGRTVPKSAKHMTKFHEGKASRTVDTYYSQKVKQLQLLELSIKRLNEIKLQCHGRECCVLPQLGVIFTLIVILSKKNQARVLCVSFVCN